MAKVRLISSGCYAFYCPGCQTEHVYYVAGSSYAHKWQFNGNVNNPSFAPSLLNRWGVYVNPNFKPDLPAGEDYTKPPYSGVCHLYVTNGKIEYCNDCTHDHNGLKGVEMKEYPDNP